MKTLNDIKQDMSDLYDQVKNGGVEIKTAAELANIAGKYLKAEQLQLARDIFIKGMARHEQPALPENGTTIIDARGATDGEAAAVGVLHS
jgi:hypothetical protein